MKRDRIIHSLFLPAIGRLGDVCWRPAVDLYRGAGGWIVKCDLAGVRPDEIVVSTCGRILTVRGSRRDHLSESGHRHYRMEISYSSFERSIELPMSLEQVELKTEYKDGMLLIYIPKENGT
jgi:HSP20 family protein